MARTVKRVKLHSSKSTKTPQQSRGAQPVERAKQNRKGRKLNSWDESRMKSAIEEFKKGEQGLRHIARAWNVPKSTLARRVKGLVNGCRHASGKQPVLPPSAEDELVEVITTLSARGFPLSRKDIQNLAFEYAQQQGLKGFSNQRGSAGYYWLKGFMQRHTNLSCRKPESLSVCRASGVNKEVIEKWFDLYEKTLNDLQIKDCPSHVWNTDETGLQDHFMSQSVVAAKGKPCYEINPGEKGQTTTVLATFNAVGTYAPLVFIFKGKRLKAEWCIGAPVDSLVRVSDNGWITSELFVEFGKKFVASLPKDDPRPHLLLLDGHCTHVYNMEFLTLMKQHNVHPLCFPAHTTHILQPADIALFKSLKHHWTVNGRKHIRDTGGRKPDKKEFFRLFEAAWKGAASVATAQSGFRESGTFPVNRNAISAEVFEPSKTSDRPLPSSDEGTDVIYHVNSVSVVQQPQVSASSGDLSSGAPPSSVSVVQLPQAEASSEEPSVGKSLTGEADDMNSVSVTQRPQAEPSSEEPSFGTPSSVEGIGSMSVVQLPQAKPASGESLSGELQSSGEPSSTAPVGQCSGLSYCCIRYLGSAPFCEKSAK